MTSWTFADFVLDLETRQLTRGGRTIPLSPKALQLLSVLVESRPRALSKIELQERLWPGTFVVEKNLTNLVGEIREALGDDPAEARFIRTVHRFGYAFREPASEARRHNLPVLLTRFIGRHREIADLARRLPDARLLTLTGAGGCGKTRLALEVARQSLDRYPDGVWLADLAPLTEPSLVPQAVASVLDIRQAPGRSLVETLADQLRSRRILLLLDNCEHVIAHASELADTLLRAATGLTIVATSREPLRIEGEATWHVPSLSLPEPDALVAPADLGQFDAVSLLVERATDVDARFTITSDNARTVADVCRRLDGMPLAIELAAARLNVLSIEQIHARLEDRLTLLARTERKPLGRQRTLEAAVDWSYDLLDERERHLMRRLSIFAGGWTLDAAEQVCSGDGIEREHVLDLMTRLVDKSLVVALDPIDGGRRFRYLETVRQYAWQRLRQSGEGDALCDRHLACFLEQVRRAEPELTKADQLRWLERLQLEHDNLRGALEWGLTSPREGCDALELAARLQWFWLKRAHFAEGRRWLERALAACAAPAPGRGALARLALGCIAFFQGEFEHALTLLGESAELARCDSHFEIVAIALGMQTIATIECRDFAVGARLAGESAAAARAAGAPWLESFSLSYFAYDALFAGDVDRAAQLNEEGLALLRRQGELWGMGIALFDLALLRVVQQQHAEARALCSEAIELGRQFGDRRAIAWCLGVLAGTEVAEGRPMRAARLQGAMDGLLERIGAPVQPTFNTLIGDRLAVAADRALGTAGYEQELAAGRAMSLAEALEFAMPESVVQQ